MWKQMLPGLRMTVLVTVLTGLVYPGAVTALCQLLFRDQANGSLISSNGRVVGSVLIGQTFTRPEYVHPRPSGSLNLGPTSRKLVDRVQASVDQLRADNPTHHGNWPADLATASASGLDPHLSPAAVAVQIDRVAQARGVAPERLRQLAGRFTEERDLGFLGEPRVNVLRLNLALDGQFPARR
jgi:potassium-transporting ATPase KdpC subunit